MVIDGTTGQNALSQLRQFHAAVQVTGLVVTKLEKFLKQARPGAAFVSSASTRAPIQSQVSTALRGASSVTRWLAPS